MPLWRRARKFGTGFGIAIANGDLETVIVRSRPSGSAVVASAVIGNFATRPAAEWGAELLGFLRAAAEPHLAATIVLPREEVIVRTVRLPGVTEKDTASAIELQLDTLHPWEDTPIEWAWWRVTATDVVVGIVRQATLSEFETLFSEAGIPIAAVTFSSAVIHAALRLQQAAPASIFCYMAPGQGRLRSLRRKRREAVLLGGFRAFAGSCTRRGARRTAASAGASRTGFKPGSFWPIFGPLIVTIFANRLCRRTGCLGAAARTLR